MRTMGHAIQGEGFYCLQFVEDAADAALPAAVEGNVALITAAAGVLPRRVLDAELANLVDGDWDWKVAARGEGVFAVTFPTAEMLTLATRSGKLYLSINDITVDICKPSIDEPLGEEMPEVWVKLSGIPPKHRRADRLLEAMYMLGRPIAVDETSLSKAGPVRMRFGCRAPEKLRGSVQVWFNGRGFDISVEPELPVRRAPIAPPPPPPSDKGPNNDDMDKDKED